MFKVGEYIIYGSNGVCKVESIGQMDVKGMNNDRVYYTLVPVYEKKSKVFTPVDNKKVVMRPVISKKEACDLIDHISDLQSLSILDSKKQDDVFKEAFRKCDCKELVRIIKTLYEKKQTRIAEGKKVTAGDERYYRMAEESLYGELAIALGIEKDQVEDYITERMA